MLVVLVIEVIISALYNNVISKNYLYILQLTTYVLCFVVLRYSSTTFDEVSLYEMLRGVIIFVAVVGILQWLATMDILPIKRILKISKAGIWGKKHFDFFFWLGVSSN